MQGTFFIYNGRQSSRVGANTSEGYPVTKLQNRMVKMNQLRTFAAKASDSTKGGFTNKLRFAVLPSKTPAFKREWEVRRKLMEQNKGFVELTVDSLGKIDDKGIEFDEWTVSSVWESIPDWEEYSLGDEARRSHLPLGTYQFVPVKGEGFPEDHIPIKNLQGAVNAKYK